MGLDKNVVQPVPPNRLFGGIDIHNYQTKYDAHHFGMAVIDSAVSNPFRETQKSILPVRAPTVASSRLRNNRLSGGDTLGVKHHRDGVDPG